jgi:peptidoglycan/LPS O-acetylase OafA/YrhL
LAYPFFSRPDAESWSRWFLRRAYRILPPYYASALLFWGMYAALREHPFTLFGMMSPPRDPISLKGLFVCATLLNAYFNPSYWTLALEARWYFLFPVLMRLWRRAGQRGYSSAASR